MPDIENLWQYAIAAAIIFLILFVLFLIMRRAGSPVRMKRGDRLAVSETRAWAIGVKLVTSIPSESRAVYPV